MDKNTHQMSELLRSIPSARHSTFYRSYVKMGYSLNKQGFRCTEFKDRKDINVMTVGCSNALGWNVPITHRYSKVFCDKVSESTGKSVADWNLGLPAKSNDYIARIILNTTKLLKPDIVLIGFTGISRREYWDCKGKCIDFVPSNVFKIVKQKAPEDLHIHKRLATLQSEYENINNFVRNFQCINSVLQGTSWYYTISSEEETGGSVEGGIKSLVPQEKYAGDLEIKDLTADGIYPGVHSHYDLGVALSRRYLKDSGIEIPVTEIKCL